MELFMMSAQNSQQPDHQEPKVIALAAVKPDASQDLLWQIGLALLGYSWLSFLLH
jgi:hypothetical protein